MSDNTKYLKVPNWEEFQHYKDRTPPWIKLHRSILTDYKFICLQDASKLHLVMLWLYASQHNNEIPCDSAFLTRVLQLQTEVDLTVLIDNGFLVEQSASKPQAKRSSSRGEESREDSAFDAFWNAYPRKQDKAKSKLSWNRLNQTQKELATEDCKTRYEHTEKQFIPLPTTYLNGKRWEDEPLTGDTPRQYGAGAI